MLDARLNVARVQERDAELSRVARCLHRGGGQQDFGRCAESVLPRASRPRRRRPSLRLGFVAALRRG